MDETDKLQWHALNYRRIAGVQPESGAVTRGGAGRGQGRKALPPEEATKPRSVRLNDARWEKLKRLGAEWLAKQIDKAKEPQ